MRCNIFPKGASGTNNMAKGNNRIKKEARKPKKNKK